MPYVLKPQACRAAFTPTSDLMVFCIATWAYFSFLKPTKICIASPLRELLSLMVGFYN